MMNYNFFSTEMIFIDHEALKYSAQLIEKLGKQAVQDTIASYLKDTF